MSWYDEYLDCRDLDYDEDDLNMSCEYCGYRWHSRIIRATRLQPSEAVNPDCPRCDDQVANEIRQYRMLIVAPLDQEETEELCDEMIQAAERKYPTLKISIEIEEI